MNERKKSKVLVNCHFGVQKKFIFLGAYNFLSKEVLVHIPYSVTSPSSFAGLQNAISPKVV